MKKKTTILIIMLFGLLLTACTENDNNETSENEREVPVEVTEAKIDDFIVEKSIYGRTQPKDITPIMIPMPGEISELEVKNGDTVEEDDLIAKIETQAGVQDVLAPASGEIIELSSEEGSLIDESEPLAMIYDEDELKVTFTVTNAVRALFEDAEDISAQIDGDTYDVDITSLNKLPDDTGLYPIEGTIKNKDSKLLPGMVAVLALPENRVKDAIILPTEAIVEESEGAFVYKVENDQVTKLDVNIIETQTDVTAIEGDIEEEDQIVINGQLTLSDGSQVVVVEEGNES